MIRVMLVDDHDVVRAGLKNLLEATGDFHIVAEASNGIEALNKMPEELPDVIVMDISMPEMDGLEATRRIVERWPEAHILVLTVHEDKQYFFEMLRAGATGYLSKRAAPDELQWALRAVARGEVYLQPALARWLLEDYQRQHLARKPTHRPAHPGLEVLSAREKQVLEMIAQGHTTQEIAQQLGISPNTVARHRERIMRKLDLHSCAALVRFAFTSGLVEP